MCDEYVLAVEEAVQLKSAVNCGHVLNEGFPRLVCSPLCIQCASYFCEERAGSEWFLDKSREAAVHDLLCFLVLAVAG